MVEVQTWYPFLKKTMWQQLGPLVMCFHLEANANSNDQNIAIDFMCVVSSVW